MAILTKLQPMFPKPVTNLLRSVEQNRIQHAYIFHGPHMSDNTAIASGFSTCLICEKPTSGDACGKCHNCILMAQKTHPDFFLLSPNEKGIISIEIVRANLKKLFLSSAQAKRKVFLIEAADTMNASSQNAILKALEEPPLNTHFILSIKQPKQLLITVRSRCQSIHINAVGGQEVQKWCDENEIPAEIQPFIKTLSGNNIQEAEILKEQNIATLYPLLKKSLEGKSDNIFHTVADLAASKDSFLLCLALLEVIIRDELARRFGCHQNFCYAKPILKAHTLTNKNLRVLTEHIQKLRTYKNIALNRSMALESILLELFPAQ